MTTQEINQKVADTNMKAVEAVCKELGINLGDMITKYRNEAGFIAGAIKSIVMKQVQEDMKNESELNALENSTPE